jgi:hypothetical protein
MLFSVVRWIFNIKRLSMKAETIIPIVMAAMEIEMIAAVDFFMLALLFLMLLIDKIFP